MEKVFLIGFIILTAAFSSAYASGPAASCETPTKVFSDMAATAIVSRCVGYTLEDSLQKAKDVYLSAGSLVGGMNYEEARRRIRKKVRSEAAITPTCEYVSRLAFEYQWNMTSVNLIERGIGPDEALQERFQYFVRKVSEPIYQSLVNECKNN